MVLFTPIKEEDLINGDVLRIDCMLERKSIAKSNYGEMEWYSDDVIHAIYKNGNFYCIIDYSLLEFDNKYELEFNLHNYKYICKNEAFLDEAYPDIEAFSGFSIFQGKSYIDNDFVESTGLIWERKSQLLKNFKMIERINQKRRRKLKRINED